MRCPIHDGQRERDRIIRRLRWKNRRVIAIRRSVVRAKRDERGRFAK